MKLAALKCRQRKKQWLTNLQNQVEYLNKDNKEMETEVTTLREEILNLKTLIIAHKDCPVARRNSSIVHQQPNKDNNNNDNSQEAYQEQQQHQQHSATAHVNNDNSNNSNNNHNFYSFPPSTSTPHFLPATSSATATTSFYQH